MKTFIVKVDARSRKAMADYLAWHFRYYTMHSCNNSTSYAHDMKIRNLGLGKEMQDRLLGLIECEDFYHGINDLITGFGADHGYRWQAGFNGRSGGYLVLYQGGQRPSGYKSYCASCYQQSYKTVGESGGSKCGRCGQAARKNYGHTHMEIYTQPGMATDQGEDFADWDMDSLRDRVKLVQEFDELAERILHEAVYLAEHYEAADEEYLVKQARKVLREAV